MVYCAATETPPIFVLSIFRFVLDLVFSSQYTHFLCFIFYEHIPLFFIVASCDDGHLKEEGGRNRERRQILNKQTKQNKKKLQKSQA